MSKIERFIVGALVCATAAAAFAAETISYKYDARGRLIQVNRTGSINNGVVTNYTIDKADNRLTKTKSP